MKGQTNYDYRRQSYLGHWPFRNLRNNTAQTLSKAAENGITHMLVSSLNAIFYKVPCAETSSLSEQEALTAKRCFCRAAINPTYTAWKKDLTVCIKDYGFKGISCSRYITVIRSGIIRKAIIMSRAPPGVIAYELGGVVRINAGFENFRQRHMLDIKSRP